MPRLGINAQLLQFHLRPKELIIPESITKMMLEEYSRQPAQQETLPGAPVLLDTQGSIKAVLLQLFRVLDPHS